MPKQAFAERWRNGDEAVTRLRATSNDLHAVMRRGAGSANG